MTGNVAGAEGTVVVFFTGSEITVLFIVMSVLCVAVEGCDIPVMFAAVCKYELYPEMWCVPCTLPCPMLLPEIIELLCCDLGGPL